MQKITPWLWFDTEAEEAANHYVSIFANRPGAKSGASKIDQISHYGDAGPREAGLVLTVTFQLDGQDFAALNGGPEGFTFDESVSFLVGCEDQAGAPSQGKSRAGPRADHRRRCSWGSHEGCAAVLITHGC